jgi:hypothetical protein
MNHQMFECGRMYFAVLSGESNIKEIQTDKPYNK